jgi:hypothetical protein
MPVKRHPNLGAVMADILRLPPDVDRGAMFAAQVGARRNWRFLPAAKIWLNGKQCAYCEAKAEAELETMLQDLAAVA